MMRKILACMVWLVPLALTPSCGGRAERVCDVACDCEHCSDLAKDYRCELAHTAQDVAEVYGCEEEWDEYAECYEKQGECNVEDASYSTQQPGSCSGTVDSMMPCMVDADCNGIPGATCATTCQYRACAGNQSPCNSDNDCGGGIDRCEEQGRRLNACVDLGSDDPYASFIFFFGGETQQPQG